MAMIARILIDNTTQSELIPEWGLSVWIEYGGHKLLLDTGTTGAFIKNAEMMGLEIRDIEYGVLSHAHYDHADGMEDFFAYNEKASFYLREGAGENCYDGKEESARYIGIKKGYLERFADRIIYVKGEHEFLPGAFLIPHKTPGREKLGVKAGMYVKWGDEWMPDTFSHEQSLVLHTEKGLVIWNSCSHGGAGNIIRETADTWPDKRIYALIGGFHLFKSSDEEVRELAREIEETGIEKIYTGHCTGEKAFDILKEELKEKAEKIYTGMEIRIGE